MKAVFAITLVLAFGSMAVFGVAAMSHNASTGMSEHCPFAPGSSAMCQMNGLLHAEHWQGLFIATQTFLLFTLLAIAAGLIVGCGRFLTPRTLVGAVFRARARGDVRVTADFLAHAFSTGILHPRVYA